MFVLLLYLFLVLIILPGTVDLTLVTLGALIPRIKNGEKGEFVDAVVVVPAHNEASSIKLCLESLRRMRGNPHIVVVADNCDDETAYIAKSMGAEVLERYSESEKGKHYALNFAFQTLVGRGFEWFIVVDADTSVSSDFLEEISLVINKRGSKAIQGRYSIRNAGESSRTRLMNVAFLSQYLRMRGKSRLGLSTGIQGNGFALHREVVLRAPMKVDYITEDIAYHLDLVMRGYVVDYCETAEVFADMPVTSEGIKSQRSRWEGGRFRVIKDYLPKLSTKGIRGNLFCWEPILDLLLLPLGYHLLGVLLLMVLSGASLLSLVFFIIPVVHVALSIFFGGGSVKDIMVLGMVPYYIFWKIVNLKSVVKSSKDKISWVRTDRGRHSK